MEVIALSGTGNPLVTLKASLRGGRLVCLLSDRDLTARGVEVQLLGEPARLPGGPAALARMTRAPLVALTLTFRGPLLHLDFSEPIAVRRGKAGLVTMTQEIADWFTAGIRRTPADWHMLQPVFGSDLDRGDR